MGDVERYRSVDHADVHKSGRFAGWLTRDGNTTTFSYAVGYDGPDVSFSLPRDGAPAVSPEGVLPPFFSGLLPEGSRLSMLRQAVKTSFDDELSLLLAVGNDLPGDVQVVPAGEAPEWQPPLVSGHLEEIDFSELAPGVDRHGIAGVQEKVSACVPDAQAILKLSPKDYPFLVENEHLHLTAVRHLGLPVAEFRLVSDRNGITGLLVTRFDRAAGGVRIAMEDAAQVMGIAPAAKYNVSAEDVTRTMASKTAMPRVATRALYLQFIFAWLTGNGDLHAKNISVLQRADGAWDLSPIYDVPSTALYRDFTLALPVSGKTKDLKLRHWDEFADSIGLPQRAARSANAVALKAAAAADLAQLPLTGSPIYGAERELALRRAALS